MGVYKPLCAPLCPDLSLTDQTLETELSAAAQRRNYCQLLYSYIDTYIKRKVYIAINIHINSI